MVSRAEVEESRNLRAILDTACQSATTGDAETCVREAGSTLTQIGNDKLNIAIDTLLTRYETLGAMPSLNPDAAVRAHSTRVSRLEAIRRYAQTGADFGWFMLPREPGDTCGLCHAYASGERPLGIHQAYADYLAEASATEQQSQLTLNPEEPDPGEIADASDNEQTEGQARTASWRSRFRRLGSHFKPSSSRS